MGNKQSRTESPKGLLDVLMALEKNEKSFTELKSLDLSPNTLLARLREAQEKGLIVQELAPVKGKRPRIKYKLTKEGRDTLQKYASVREKYTELKMELQQLQEEVRKKEKELKYLLLSF
jgi:DNA-binding HxlR family transcriptional regulator